MYSVLPFPVFVTLPSRPSSRFRPIAPSLCLLSAFSALKSPCTLSCQLARRPNQPNRFPLFSHPVNIAHTPTPANPFRSIVYFTVLCARDFSRFLLSPISSYPSHTPVNPLDATLTGFRATTHSKALAPNLSSLHATLTKNPGGPHACPDALLTIHYSLLTSPLIPLHYSP